MYLPEYSPEITPEYLYRELNRISDAFRLVGHYAVTYVAPDKPRAGDVVYADGTEWIPDQEKDSTVFLSQPPGSASADIIAIPAAQAKTYWAHLRELVLPAFERFPGETSEQKIFHYLQRGSWTLWIVWDEGPVGGFITELYQYSEFKALRVVALGGKFDFGALDEMLGKFAGYHGCKRIEFYGRRGWEKKLPQYSVYRIMMVKDL